MSLRLPSAPRSGFLAGIIEAALAPHPVDRYLELVDPMMTWRDMRAKVVGIERRTDRTVTLTLQPTRQWGGHKAGQFIQLSTVIDGVRQSRCFSPANAADGGAGPIELTVTAHPDGFVSRHLREHTAIGDVLGLSAADGDFTLPDDLGPHAVFISGGSGVTPVLSMMRTLIANGYTGTITFVHYARTPDDVPYGVELETFAAAYENLDVRMRYTDVPGGEFFSPAHLDGIAGLDTDGDAQIFLCGPAPLMDDVKGYCAQRDISDRLHFEAFTLTTPTIDPNEPVTGELTFTLSSTGAANDGRTILEQAESAGLSPESGCRMGICFSCTAIKKSGCTRNVLTGETDTEADKHIQLCINQPVGDVEIEV
ncbi:putative NADPH oxidoreductase [Gordonia effusa NBRC 100432]|uniref:Putative NADPH oxidoreductase n=1 Tax=Gordonia effusa NBRC 100432 TaxID=1077974 RepID=H0R5Q8_9ACTN|nr:FAD-binding oxidoreductase [Gordonia effusa]GAB20409.1 putative NADPH oxidoreductase [Gordonia effusa NBRC 100432]